MSWKGAIPALCVLYGWKMRGVRREGRAGNLPFVPRRFNLVSDDHDVRDVNLGQKTAPSAARSFLSLFSPSPSSLFTQNLSGKLLCKLFLHVALHVLITQTS